MRAFSQHNFWNFYVQIIMLLKICVWLDVLPCLVERCWLLEEPAASIFRVEEGSCRILWNLSVFNHIAWRQVQEGIQWISHQPLTTELGVWFQASPHGVNRRLGTEIGFSLSTLIFLCQYFAISAPYSFAYLLPVFHNLSNWQHH